MTIEDLLVRWNAIPGSAGGTTVQCYDAQHPLTLFYGVGITGHFEFFLLADDLPETYIMEGRSIEVKSGKRQDGKSILLFRLLDSAQEEVFIRLCYDLAESSRISETAYEGYNILLKRFNVWRQLVASGPSDILSENSIKGLWGELYFLLKAISKYGVKNTIHAWMGPHMSDQDFIFSDAWYEIKAAGHGAASLLISSLEQLDRDDRGYLVWIPVEKSNQQDCASKTIVDLIMQIELAMDKELFLLNIFRDKLGLSGYSDHPSYEEYYFRPTSVKYYNIDRDFPRLRRSHISKDIVTSTYSISTAALQNFLDETNGGIM